MTAASRWIRVCSRTCFEGEAAARRPVRTIGTMADITQRKEAEERLQDSEERFNQLVNNIGGYFWLKPPTTARSII